MQQGNGDIDKILFEAYEELDIDRLGHDADAYMSRMMHRFREEQGSNQTQVKPVFFNGNVRTAAFSLIAAGLLLGFVYTSGMQDSLIGFECKLKANYAMIKSNMDMGKLFLGE